MRCFESITGQVWEEAPSSVQDRAAHPGASSQLQDAECRAGAEQG